MNFKLFFVSDELAKLENKKYWWLKFFNVNCFEKIDYSSKLVLFFEILAECEERNEKLLVFSQCLSTLNTIEYFLKVKSSKKWILNQDYFKIHGSVVQSTRHKYTNIFNDKNNKRARLLLISTKAGGLGINLVAANRVIIFDVSWNPSDDLQSIFRVYR